MWIEEIGTLNFKITEGFFPSTERTERNEWIFLNHKKAERPPVVQELFGGHPSLQQSKLQESPFASTHSEMQPTCTYPPQLAASFVLVGSYRNVIRTYLKPVGILLSSSYWNICYLA